MTDQRKSLRPRSGPFALARTLAWLRLCAIAGQSVAIMFCSTVMGMDVALLPLFIGVGMLAIFAAYASWRLLQPWPLSEWEAVVHIAADTMVLGYLLYFTGGASNPFVTLLLVPIALAAAALTVGGVSVVAALAGLAYVLLVPFHVPLPTSGSQATDFDLHVAGMGVNFIVTAVLLGVFISNLARTLRMQQSEVQRVRERALRDEGILAIATQAAGAAHELNTPLSTMRTLLPELQREHAADKVLADDLELLQGQVDRCRTILREMVAFGQAQLSQVPERLTLDAFLHGCLERFQLLRPEADLEVLLSDAAGATLLRSPPGLRHALINLLNNAVDASSLNDSVAVTLEARVDGAWLELIVSDHGPGFDEEDDELGTLGQSRKTTGLGLGLALAEATAERLDGELAATNTDRGAEMRLRLPLAVIGERT
ncbi:two-component system sensor histidine kinase RegB [Luteibacter sp. Sphag1AF]|uniref:ATP-binding protein n=1 Tax=Luteibacter sp. Sphag1AF TaxID=2587031 RepID=UPI001854A69A|nr:two-component system sensor histidine kinase RegB [Luteibacter sp. Sphag1AF]